MDVANGMHAAGPGRNYIEPLNCPFEMTILFTILRHCRSCVEDQMEVVWMVASQAGSIP